MGDGAGNRKQSSRWSRKQKRRWSRRKGSEWHAGKAQGYFVVHLPNKVGAK